MADFTPTPLGARPTLRRNTAPRRHWSLRLLRFARNLVGNVVGLAVVLPSAAFGTALIWDDLPEAIRGAPVAVTTGEGDVENGDFTRCASDAATDCTLDGRTFRYGGVTVRLADIEAPATRAPACTAELEAGEAGARALARMLNAGGFRLSDAGAGRDADGNVLRIVTRDGRSFGAALVRDGHAEPAGHSVAWCA